MISFDESFDPPAVVVTATLTGVVRARPRVTVRAIIDTGADITAVPEELKESLRLYAFSSLQMEDARGGKEPVLTYEVRIAVAERGPTTLEVILVPFPFAVLGRDWLRQFHLLLNGPEQKFLLSASPILTYGE